MKLKNELIDIGKQYPELQDHLRTILDGLEEVHEDPELIHVPKELPPLIQDRPSEPTGINDKFFNLSPESFRAFNTVILPQIQAKLDETSFEDLGLMMDEIESLGRSMNIDLETALIGFKPISMNTKKFFTEIQEAFRNWLRPKMKTMETPDTDAGNRVNMFFLPQ